MLQYSRQQLLVRRIIWAALFGSIVIYQFALGGGVPSGPNAPGMGINFAVVLGVAQVMVATLIRWSFIPRANTPRQLLVGMIVGLALSEAVELYGLFLMPPDQPSTKLALWVLSLASAAQFIPI